MCIYIYIYVTTSAQAQKQKHCAKQTILVGKRSVLLCWLSCEQNVWQHKNMCASGRLSNSHNFANMCIDANEMLINSSCYPCNNFLCAIIDYGWIPVLMKYEWGTTNEKGLVITVETIPVHKDCCSNNLENSMLTMLLFIRMSHKDVLAKRSPSTELYPP